MKILIGYDGSGYADAALDHLRRAGLPRRADALVVSVATRKLTEPPPSSYELVEAMQKVGPDSDSQSGVGKEASLAEAEALALALQASKRLKSMPGGSLARLVTAIVIAPGLNVERQTERAKESHHGAKALLRSAGLEVSSLTKISEPEHLLLEESETWQADCIFVGARGLGRAGRFLLGSVSTAVVSDAKCSVEIVRVRRPNETGESL